MKVAFLTLEYPPAGGGIASSLATLAPALVRRGHEVRIVGWSSDARSAVDQGVKIDLNARTRLPKLGWWLNPRRVERQLRQLVKSGELQVVIAHDWCGPSAGISPGCPVGVWCHGSACYFSDLAGERPSARVARAERRALRSAQSVAAVSAYTAKRTQELFSLKERPSVIHNGVDVERFKPAPRERVDRDTLLYFGTIVRKKGVLELCAAFNRVVEQVPLARLVVAGRDSRDSETGATSTWELCQLVLSDSAQERTQYLGFVPYRKIEELIKTCAAAVLPSRAEALPLAWMEVMACGRPVVAADVGWAPELVRSGKDGILVAQGDVKQLAGAMIDVLRDSDGSDVLGKAARSRMVTSFSEEVAAAEFEGWLKGLVQS